MESNTNVDELNNPPTFLLIVLAVLVILFFYALWGYLRAQRKINKWKNIGIEMDNCGDDLQCKKHVLYKYGEGDTYEEAVRYCYAKYKDMCPMIKHSEVEHVLAEEHSAKPKP